MELNMKTFQDELVTLHTIDYDRNKNKFMVSRLKLTRESMI